MEDLEKYVTETLVRKGLGIQDPLKTEIEAILSQPLAADYIFADMVSRRAQIGWSTHGHTAVDVNIYGTVGAETLRGNHENTEVGEFLRHYLDVDVKEVTKELNKKTRNYNIAANGMSWMGARPSDEEIRTAPDHRHHPESI